MINLKPWEACNLPIRKSIMLFIRRPNNDEKISESLVPWFTGHEVTILYNNVVDFWWADSPYYGHKDPLSPIYKVSRSIRSGNTAESVMFKIDLFLLESGKFSIEEPFIFPMNEL